MYLWFLNPWISCIFLTVEFTVQMQRVKYTKRLGVSLEKGKQESIPWSITYGVSLFIMISRVLTQFPAGILENTGFFSGNIWRIQFASNLQHGNQINYYKNVFTYGFGKYSFIHSFDEHLFRACPTLDTILVTLNLIVTINSVFVFCLLLQIIGVSPVIHTPSASHITVHIILELVFLLSVL